MKTWNITSALIGIGTALLSPVNLQAQGTVTFDSPWFTDGIAFVALYPDSSGMSVEVVADPGQLGASLARVGGGRAGHPNNGTPHLEPSSTLAPGFVRFAFTDAASQGHWFTNGAPIGLASVDLADPVAPSLSPVSITFDGFRADGSMVAQTFTTPGGGATTFQTYSFDADFASGIVRVEIPSTVWAMDNFVFTVPEPGVGSLLLLGWLALRCRAARSRRF
jgi:hypothetical protein